MVKFKTYLNLINETKEAEEIINPIIYWKLKEINESLKNNRDLKFLNEGSTRKVYLIKSRKTVLKIAFNQDGIKQNNLEYKDNLEYNLVTPKIIQVFKIKNKTIAIECELVNTLEDFFNIDCLKHLRMDYKTFHILIEQLQKNIFDYNDFFIEIKNKQNSGKLNIYGKLFELNYTKEKFKTF